METMTTMAELTERITALGPWFHNICLGGLYTAPHHFLMTTLELNTAILVTQFLLTLAASGFSTLAATAASTPWK
jgi:hypothetical protein